MSRAGPLNQASLLCRAKLLFVSHETDWPGKRYKNSCVIFGRNAIFALILKNAIFIDINCFGSFNSLVFVLNS